MSNFTVGRRDWLLFDLKPSCPGAIVLSTKLEAFSTSAPSLDRCGSPSLAAVSRPEVCFFGCNFSQFPLMRPYPAPQVIFVHWSSSATNPVSQIKGQMRAGLLLTASSASLLANLVSSFMPVYRLNNSIESRDARSSSRPPRRHCSLPGRSSCYRAMERSSPVRFVGPFRK
jgi:hypothetical protein